MFQLLWFVQFPWFEKNNIIVSYEYSQGGLMYQLRNEESEIHFLLFSQVFCIPKYISKLFQGFFTYCMAKGSNSSPSVLSTRMQLICGSQFQSSIYCIWYICFIFILFFLQGAKGGMHVSPFLLILRAKTCNTVGEQNPSLRESLSILLNGCEKNFSMSGHLGNNVNTLDFLFRSSVISLQPSDIPNSFWWFLLTISLTGGCSIQMQPATTRDCSPACRKPFSYCTQVIQTDII